MNQARLTHLGTGDALHGAGMGHTSQLLEDSRGRLLVDVGPTVPFALARAGIELASIGTVLVTHLHGDHFAGLPYLLLSALRMAAGVEGASIERPVRPPLVVVGPPGTEERVERLFQLLYERSAAKPRPFVVDYRVVRPGESLEVGGRRIEAFPALHLTGIAEEGGLALSYRIETDAGVLAVSGDTGRHEALSALAAGAALFVCEATFGEGESERSAARRAKHLSVDDVRELRRDWSCGAVTLTHLSAVARAELEARPVDGTSIATDGLVTSIGG